ncbi:conserved protein of unknown function [Ectopseudomonas oleovorans]|uniref:Uncharacterized protein n=1 Tax=Ectopseudomonas oleovorans TaxID=301 RepID=A0A653B190_ECTOL|nr:conserved protein of unknown function [Pseudomonas oleovorans]
MCCTLRFVSSRYADAGEGSRAAYPDRQMRRRSEKQRATRPSLPEGRKACAHPLLVLLDLFELSVDHVVTGILGVTGVRLGGTGLRLLGVHLLRQRRGGLGQGVHLGLDSFLVVALQCDFQFTDGFLDGGLLLGSRLVARLGEHLAGGVHQLVALVARSGQLFELAVFLGVGLGVTHHLLDLFLGQTGVGLDHDGLLLASGLVLGGHVQDAVGIDIEGHFDLRHATRSRRNLGQVELAEGLVLRRLLALALQHVNGHGALVVVGGGEHLRLLGRDGGVLLDQRGHHATHGFDTQGQRGNVQQQHVLDITSQYRALNGSAHGHGFVRVDVLARLLAEELGNGLLHQRHAGLTTDQDHVVDLADVDAGILQRGAARLDGALHQVLDQRLQLGAGDLHVQVLRTAGICSDVRQVDVSLLARGQLDLGLLGSFLQALHRQRVTLEVHAGFFLELVDEVVDQTNVEVLTTEEGVAVGGQHFELVLAVDFGDLDHRHVEGTATQVIDDHGVVALGLVHAIGQRSRGRLVDDALYVQTGDATGILGGLTLAVVEVGRNGDHRFGDRLAKVVLSGLLHLLQHFGADLRRGHLLAVDLDPGVVVVSLDDLVRNHLDVFLHDILVETTTDQTLHRIQGVVRIGHGLALGRLANQGFAVVGVSDDGRRGASAFGVLQHLDVAVFQNGDAGVGGPQVDTDDFAHENSPETLIFPSPRFAGAGSTKTLDSEMGSPPKISSLLVDGRRRRGRRLAHHDHGRAQQAAVEQVALLEHLEHRVRLDVDTLFHRHGLVMLRVERSAMRVQRFQLMTRQGVDEQLEGQLHALAHALDRLVVRARQLQTTFQAVDDRQQVVGEFFQGELVRLLHVLLGATTHVLQLGRHAQRLVLRCSQLLFQCLHASRQVIARRDILCRLSLGVLRIQVLFVSHAYLLSNESARVRPAHLPAYMESNPQLSRGDRGGLSGKEKTLYK